MKEQIDRFWCVMRLSKTSDDLQQVDSLPHKKHPTAEEANAEARRLAELFPEARGFVVLKMIGFYTPPLQEKPSPRLTKIIADFHAGKYDQLIARAERDYAEGRALDKLE